MFASSPFLGPSLGRMAVTGLACALLLLACSAEKADWQTAQSADSIEAYNNFIGKHPQSALANEARERTKQLVEERDWERATETDSMESYQAFMSKHPEGKWAEEARIRIENFNVLGAPAKPAEAAPAPAQAAAGSAAAAPAAAPLAAAAPAPKPAARPAVTPETKPAAVASGGYRVQLGALSSVANANAEWQRLKGRFGSELGTLAPSIVEADTAKGKLYRLQSVTGTEDKSRSLCAVLTKAGQACVVVAPK